MKVKKTRFGDYERRVHFKVWSDYEIHVVFGEDLGVSRKARYGSIGASEGAGAMHSSAMGGHAHLFFKIGKCPTGVVAHECWHAVYHMMTDWAGVKELDDETVAYHVGYLVQQVVDFRNDLIDAGVGIGFGVKSSSRKQASDGSKDTQRELAGLQGVPAQCGGVGTKAGEAGTPFVQAQACDGSNGGPSSTPTGRIRVGRAWRGADE